MTNLILAIRHLKDQLEKEPPFSVRRAELRELVDRLETLAKNYPKAA